MPTNPSAVTLRDVVPSDFPLLLEWIPIAHVIIAPAFRGRGLARPLVQAVMQLVRDDGAVRELGLYVVPGNEIAIHTYERLGFAAAEPRPEHPEFDYMSLSL